MIRFDSVKDDRSKQSVHEDENEHAEMTKTIGFVMVSQPVETVGESCEIILVQMLQSMIILLFVGTAGVSAPGELRVLFMLIPVIEEALPKIFDNLFTCKI